MEIDLGSVPVAKVGSGGCPIAYRQVGQGTPLLLVMGLGAAGVAWQDHVRAYGDGFRCIIPDNRGAGQSGATPGPYSSAQMADDCAAVLAAIGAGPAPVVGISMGGVIAQELALRHPDLVSAMVLVSTWCRCDRYLEDIFGYLSRAQQQLSAEDFAQALQWLIWSPNYVTAHTEELREVRGLAPGSRLSAEAFSAQCAACVSHNSLDRLAEIRVPTLVTAGVEDIFTLRDNAEQLEKGIPGARLEVMPGGHAHHWEELDGFNELTVSWLEQQVAVAAR
jgi:pimeloyl-ACP methyl ester carboxylesterase